MHFTNFPYLNMVDNILANFAYWVGPSLHDGSAALSEASVNIGLI